MFSKLLVVTALVAVGVKAGSILDDCDVDSVTLSSDGNPNDLNQHWWLHARCGGVQVNPLLVNNCFINRHGELVGQKG